MASISQDAVPVADVPKIRLGYDVAPDIDGDPVVLARIDMDDMARIPARFVDAFLADLDLSGASQDAAGDPAFFVGDDDHLFLMMDTDRFPFIKVDLAHFAKLTEAEIVESLDGIRAACTEDFRIQAPGMPEWIRAGQERVDTHLAFDRLSAARPDPGGDDVPRPD
ncbi:MAG: hypothetical protein F4Y68_21660 [Boseongicola sp. SB0665_bin_10]|nr:hypothetical protein [Boseongicola sp. SB0665_bin_10]